MSWSRFQCQRRVGRVRWEKVLVRKNINERMGEKYKKKYMKARMWKGGKTFRFPHEKTVPDCVKLIYLE